MTSKQPKIRTGIPVPPKPRRGPKRKHAIDKLSVGESMRINASYNSVMYCCRTFVSTHQPSWEFRAERVDDKTTDVWRVK